MRAHFRSTVGYWHDLYERSDVEAAVFQDRQEAALQRILQVAPAGGQILEVGCGAGFLTVDLARRGFRLTAVDVAPEMLDIAADRLARTGLAAAVQLREADVHALEFPDSSFDLVVALGVIPWLHTPALALAEMSRVLRLGGHVVVTSDNRARLTHLFDPYFSPLLAPARRAASAVRRRPTGSAAERPIDQHMMWTRRFRRLVAAAGLDVVSERTIGFGPFSLLGRPLLWGRHGVALHRGLQGLADSRLPLIRSAGNHHLVVARKHSDEA